jgi:predicted dehydrogenase
MEKLKVGVLGLRRGLTHFQNFLALDNVELIGAADRFEHIRERAGKCADEAGKSPKLVQEYDDLLEMKPDAIVVASNGRLQVEHACMALQAGCHVLSEVPGAFTQEEFVRLRATVELTGRQYMMGENACFWDFLRYWRKWVADGEFGGISIAEAEYLHYLPQTLMTEDGSSYSPTQAAAEGRTDARPTWRADQPPIQYLTHDLGPLLEVLDDRAVNVTCRSAPWRSKEAPLRSDGQIALFQTEKGALLKVMVTLNTRRPEEHRYRLFGTEGSAEWFRYENVSRRFTRHAERGSGWESVPIGFAALDQDTSTGHGGSDLKMAAAFTDAILAGRTVPIDIYRTIEYSLPGIMAARSADLGGAPVEIPDMRHEPFESTIFWDAVGLPEKDPETSAYQPPS